MNQCLAIKTSWLVYALDILTIIKGIKQNVLNISIFNTSKIQQNMSL
jgi:hypothetical protein